MKHATFNMLLSFFILKMLGVATLSIQPSTRVFLCSQVIDMKYSFDALSGLVTSHFGMNPLSGHIFVFFSRKRDRMKLLTWDPDGFALYYKRLERGTFSWIEDLDLNEGGEIQASDFTVPQVCRFSSASARFWQTLLF